MRSGAVALGTRRTGSWRVDAGGPLVASGHDAAAVDVGVGAALGAVERAGVWPAPPHAAASSAPTTASATRRTVSGR
jgi:hypothetical protein